MGLRGCFTDRPEGGPATGPVVGPDQRVVWSCPATSDPSARPLRICGTCGESSDPGLVACGHCGADFVTVRRRPPVAPTENSRG